MKWPLDLPVREVLQLPGETPIPWAVFDPVWYRAAHPDLADRLDPDNPRAVLEYYLDSGQTQGHAPNLFFDEAWHRAAYPGIAARIAEGVYKSAFDAYCRRGALDRSPHWLFDEPGYRERYPDLTKDVLAKFELCNNYDHYLRHGAAEDRVGHILFDPKVYLANFDPADQAAIREVGVFRHYLERLDAGKPELRTSIHFDPDWYRQRYPEIAVAIAAGQWKGALHHYLTNANPTAYDPLEYFSEAFYLRRDPGLRTAIGVGQFRNGYIHFLRYGARELRPPALNVDLVWYASDPSVKADLAQGRAPDAFTHWLRFGRQAGLHPAPPEEIKVTDAQARLLAGRLSAALLPNAGRFGCSFACPGTPVASVVLSVRDNFTATIATAVSLRSSSTLDIELIVIDRGSSDETRALGHYLCGARVLRFESDIGWLRGLDAGRQLATAPLVLFLGQDVRLAHGAVDRAVARLAGDPSIGACGGLVLRADGMIASAGGLIWDHGGRHAYQSGASALVPEANFVRDTDFCHLGFLLTRGKLLASLDGFDHECPPGHAAADLCLRIWQAGARVVYDPSLLIVSNEAPEEPSAPGEHFLRKHADALARRLPPSGPAQVIARHAGARRPKILFIEDTVPIRRTGSGFVRSNDLVQTMAELGFAVTVFPVNGCDADPALLYGDMPETTEVLHDQSLDMLPALLKGRPGYYDIVWIARVHNLARVRGILAEARSSGALAARIVLDTEAVTPCREALQANLAGTPYDFDAAMRRIAEDAALCDSTIAVTEAEAEVLGQHGLPNIAVISHRIPCRPTDRPFERRAGMLFVGAIHKTDSPNYDGIAWFVDSVLPLVEAELKWETRLTVAGYTAPDVSMARFETHPRITVRGPIADLEPLYRSHRLFVAPTRYAAGAPYKLLEAASYGLPIVATDLLRQELNWTSGQELLSASAESPEDFAQRIITLYRDKLLWVELRDSALRRLSIDASPDAFLRSVDKVLTRRPDGARRGNADEAAAG